MALPDTADGTPIIPGLRAYVIRRPILPTPPWADDFVVELVGRDYAHPGSHNGFGGAPARDCYVSKVRRDQVLESEVAPRPCPTCGRK
jgi:hypothetical protein